jgi:cytochrome c2
MSIPFLPRRAGLLLALLLVWATLAGCGQSNGQGDAAAGERLYRETSQIDPNLPTCISCHPVTAGEAGNIGPNLSNVGARAAVTAPDQTPEDYLRAAIVDPDAYLAGGYQEGIHYRGYKQALSTQQVNDLIAYMLTLKSGQD